MQFLPGNKKRIDGKLSVVPRRKKNKIFFSTEPIGFSKFFQKLCNNYENQRNRLISPQSYNIMMAYSTWPMTTSIPN